jgi:hypothetical protein
VGAARPAAQEGDVEDHRGRPVRELLTLRRLLAKGIRPRWLVVEVWPPFWADEKPYIEREAILCSDVGLSDTPVLAHLYGQGRECLCRFCIQGLTPAVHCRTGVLHLFAPLLVPRETEHNLAVAAMHWKTLDDWGWLPVPGEHASAENFNRYLEVTRKSTQPVLEKLRVVPGVEWAMREMLQTCRREGIQVALLLMPEHSALRGWYPPKGQALVHDTLQRWQRDYGAALIDARDWVPDEHYCDFCHLMPEGAVIFSTRLGREALRPLVAGEPLPPARLQSPTSSPSPAGP